MCLISIADVGLNKYSEEFKNSIRYGMGTQRDGTGFAYWKHGQKTVHFSKGFFTEKDQTISESFNVMWEQIERAKLTEKDILVIHSRSSTGGTHAFANCHPFVINTADGTVIQDIAQKLTGITKEGVLFHNGCFYDLPGPKTSAYNDTAHLTNLLFSGCIESLELLKRDQHKFCMIHSKLLGANKLSILTPGRLINIGDYVETVSGYKYSNYGFTDRSSYVDTGGKNRSNYGVRGKEYYEGRGHQYDLYDETTVYDDDLACGVGAGSSSDWYRYPAATRAALNDKEEPFEPASCVKFTPKFTALITPSYSKEVKVNPTTFKEEPVSENLITRDEIIKQLSYKWEHNQKMLQYTLMLSKDVGDDFEFVAVKNFKDTSIKTGDTVLCKNYDINDKSVCVTKTELNKETFTWIPPGMFLDMVHIVPKPSTYHIYESYLTLCAITDMSKSALKYLRKISTYKGVTGLYKIKKPDPMTLHMEGIKLFIKIWDNESNREKLIEQAENEASEQGVLTA